MLPLYMDLVHNKGPIVHFNIAGRSYILLKDPDDIKVSVHNLSNAKNSKQVDKYVCKYFLNLTRFNKYSGILANNSCS